MRQRNELYSTFFTEAQSRRWLSWLARSMSEHGQTIFLIDQLQPSWLVSRWQQWIYVLTSRLLWGLLGGLTLGLVYGSLFGLGSSVAAGLAYGLIGGLILGLCDMLRSKRAQPACSLLWQYVDDYLAVGPCIALISGLVAALDGEAGGALYARWSMGLTFGLILGPIRTIRGTRRQPDGEIRPIRLPRPINGLPVGLSSRLAVALPRGFYPSVREMGTRSNQGMWLSLRHGLFVGVSAGIAIGLAMAALAGPLHGLVFAAFSGLCAGLWFGGLDVLQHGILRLLLYVGGDAPLDYTRFLDYAADELSFMQRVGGGYVFVHRYLLEYFAADCTSLGSPKC